MLCVHNPDERFPMKIRKHVALTAVLLGTLLTAGCGNTPPTDNRGSAVPRDSDDQPVSSDTFVQTLPDGKTVLCVWAQADFRSGGLSCDWEGVDRGN